MSIQTAVERAMLTADEARALVRQAESLQGEAARQETVAVLEQIKAAANDGQASLRLERLSSVLKHQELITKRLTALGFTVKRLDGDFRDQSPGWYLISW